VDDVLARAMAKAPEDRYQDGASLAEDIEDILAGRPPRHQAEWTPRARADATLMSAAVPKAVDVREVDLPLLAEAPTTVRRRRGGPSPRLVLLLGLTVAGWFVLHPDDFAFWRTVFGHVRRSPLVQDLIARLKSDDRVPAEEPVITRPAPPRETLPPATVAAEPSPAAEVAPAPIPEDDLPIAAAASTLPAAAAVPEAPPPPGRLIVDFEHHLRSGTLRVWVDDHLALDEPFDSRRKRKILAFELREGVVEEVLPLPPGDHEVRVQVRWGDNVRTARIEGAFRSGASRRLDVSVARIGGKLSLEWK
jgi:hypothetical protein